MRERITIPPASETCSIFSKTGIVQAKKGCASFADTQQAAKERQKYFLFFLNFFVSFSLLVRIAVPREGLVA
jgi:hypothetical protein